MADIVLGPVSWERMIRAVEKVRERLLRAAKALEDAGVPYAVVGGNAVAAWVSRVDEAAVRNTQDVDILLRRADLDKAKIALAAAGFVYRHTAGIDLFLDGPGARARDAVRIVFAAEKVRKEYVSPAPDTSESEPANQFRVLTLEALVRMKLTSFRRKDQMHLLDMIGVGLIDASWKTPVSRRTWAAPARTPRHARGVNLLKAEAQDWFSGPGCWPGFGSSCRRCLASASLRRYSICPFKLRSSCWAQPSRASYRAGSMRRRNDFRGFISRRGILNYTRCRC
jgi:hypothetical protein